MPSSWPPTPGKPWINGKGTNCLFLQPIEIAESENPQNQCFLSSLDGLCSRPAGGTTHALTLSPTRTINREIRRDRGRKSTFLDACALCRMQWSAFCVDPLICSSLRPFEVGGIVPVLKMKTLSLRGGKWLSQLSLVGSQDSYLGLDDSQVPALSAARCVSQRWTHPWAHYIFSSEILSQIDNIHESFFWHEMLLFKSLEMWNQLTDQLIN